MPLLSQILALSALLSHILVLLNADQTISDHYSTLIYKNCTFTDSITNSHSESISSFFQELITKSSQEKFFKTTNTGISGHFQCRGDLSNNECYKCMTSLPQMSNTLCNKAVSARIQLHGCYVHYHELMVDDHDHDQESSDYELLHKICDDDKKAVDTLGFEQVRDAAFAAVANGVMDGNGYCKENYELMEVIAQCEGDLGPCECGKCVSIACQIAQEECGISFSGQIYLDNCFITYAYYPDGIPHNFNRGRGGRNNTGKLLAIVLGGAAALFIGYIFLLSLKKFGKKDDGI